MPVDISQSSWRVLLAEDEFLIAEDLASALSAAGATVIGPAYSVAGALRLIESCGALDGAVLDVNLKGEAAFPIADALLGRGVPFVITTGYDRQFQGAVRRCRALWEACRPSKACCCAVAGEAQPITRTWILGGISVRGAVKRHDSAE
jgi:hypothetical protein